MKLTQFEVKTNKGVKVFGEYEGNEKSGNVLVFSHGFGVTRNSHGMFDELGDLLKDEMLVVRFDYTRIVDNKTRYLYAYSVQTQMLKSVLHYVTTKFLVSELNLLGHSMGGIIIGLLDHSNVNKTILACSPLESPYERMIKYFSARSGTSINETGETRIARSDGSISILDKDFWPEMKAVNPIKLIKNLSEKTELYYVRALHDHVVTDQDYSLINRNSKVSYLELKGDHDFSGKDREGWLKKMKEIIKK